MSGVPGRDEQLELQRELAAARPPRWSVPHGEWLAGGCFVTFPRGPTGPGHAGDPAWAGAALVAIPGGRVVAGVSRTGQAGAPYEPGLLALREGPLLVAAVRALPRLPDVLICDATGRDHPRRAGLATQLGAELGVPTVGVTHRPLVADGDWPADERGAAGVLHIGGETVGAWVRVRPGRRPLAVHAAWRTDVDTAIEVVLACADRARTPEPLRQARRLARTARAKR